MGDTRRKEHRSRIIRHMRRYPLAFISWTHRNDLDFKNKIYLNCYLPFTKTSNKLSRSNLQKYVGAVKTKVKINFILTFLCFMFCVNVKEFPHDVT
jgi:hypothetical protein